MGVQLFASAWGVGLVGADRSKLERKKLCIIEKLLNYLKYIRVAKILAINSIFWGGGVQNHSEGGLINILGGVHPPCTLHPAPPPQKIRPCFGQNFAS